MIFAADPFAGLDSTRPPLFAGAGIYSKKRGKTLFGLLANFISGRYRIVQKQAESEMMNVANWRSDRPVQKRGRRRVADVREPHGSAKPKRAARNECDAVERSEAKALCHSLPQADGEELAAKGRQVRPDRAAAVAGAQPTAHESPAQGGNGGAGEKRSPAKGPERGKPTKPGL